MPTARDHGANLLPLEDEVWRDGEWRREKVKQLEDETQKLKHAVADLTPDNRAVKDVLSRKLVAPAGLRVAMSCVEVEYQAGGTETMDASLSSAECEARCALLTRLKELAAKRMRFGYRRLTAMLVREEMSANHKSIPAYFQLL